MRKRGRDEMIQTPFKECSCLYVATVGCLIVLLLTETLSVSGQTLIAIYGDGSIRAFSITSNTSVVQYFVAPEQEGTDIPAIPIFCKGPLFHSCLQAQQQQMTRKFYAIVDTRAVILQLFVGQTATSLTKTAVSFNCHPNDFVTGPDQLLVACRPLSSHDNCAYVYNAECLNIPPIPEVTLLTDPVVLSATEGDRKVVIATQTRSEILQLIVLLVDDYGRRQYSLPDDCHSPLNMSRQELTVLLDCANGTQYLVNTTMLPPTFFPINSANHGKLLALSSKGYALFLSSQQLTLQNVVSEHAVTVSINAIHRGAVIYADFSIDGYYAFVATNTSVTFIHVTQALTTGNNQFFYTLPVNICFDCPPVQFLDLATAVISSTRDRERQTTLLLIVSFNQWPPNTLLSKTLNGQPSQYWFIDDLPGLSPHVSTSMVILPNTTTRFAVPSSTSTVPSSSNPSTGTTTIVIICSVIAPVGLFICIFMCCMANRTCRRRKATPPTVTRNINPVPENIKRRPAASISRGAINPIACINRINMEEFNESPKCPSRKHHQETNPDNTGVLVSPPPSTNPPEVQPQEPHYPTQAEPESTSWMDSSDL